MRNIGEAAVCQEIVEEPSRVLSSGPTNFSGGNSHCLVVAWRIGLLAHGELLALEALDPVDRPARDEHGRVAGFQNDGFAVQGDL